MTTEYPNQLAIALHGYFADYLPRLRGMSPNTIESYRDSLVLLLRYLALRHQCPVSSLEFDSIDPAGIIDFLNYLEQERNNCAATRNVRLAAIHAFFRYVASNHPDRLVQAQRLLGIPFKRTTTRPIEYLEYEELQALLDSVDRTSIDGQRDYALLATMFNTGARVQEIIDLRARDLYLSKPYQVRLFGKGRKERFCPLWLQTTQVIRSYVKARKLDLHSDTTVFLNHRGEPLTRFGIRYILKKYLALAQSSVPRLARKRLHPHSLRYVLSLIMFLVSTSGFLFSSLVYL